MPLRLGFFVGTAVLEGRVPLALFGEPPAAPLAAPEVALNPLFWTGFEGEGFSIGLPKLSVAISSGGTGLSTCWSVGLSLARQANPPSLVSSGVIS